MTAEKTAMQAMDRVIRAAQWRATAALALRHAGWAVVAAALAGLLLLAADRLLRLDVPVVVYGLLLLAALPAAIGAAYLRRPDGLTVAQRLDERLGLKDQIATAAVLRRDGVVAAGDSPFAALVEQRAAALAETVRAEQVVELRPAPSLWTGVALTAALLLGAWLIPYRPAPPVQTAATTPGAEAPEPGAAPAERSAVAADAIDQALEEIPADAEELDAPMRTELAALDALSEQLAANDPNVDPASVRDEAAARLDAVAERLASTADRDLEAIDEVAQRFSRMPRPDAPLTAEQFEQALRRGDFGRAAQELERLLDSRGTISDAEREALAEHFRARARDAQQSAQAESAELEAQRQQVQQAMRDLGLSDQQMRDVIDTAAESPEAAAQQLAEQGVDEDLARSMAQQARDVAEREQTAEQTDAHTRQLADVLNEAAEQMQEPAPPTLAPPQDDEALASADAQRDTHQTPPRSADAQSPPDPAPPLPEPSAPSAAMDDGQQPEAPQPPAGTPRDPQPRDRSDAPRPQDAPDAAEQPQRDAAQETQRPESSSRQQPQREPAAAGEQQRESQPPEQQQSETQGAQDQQQDASPSEQSATQRGQQGGEGAQQKASEQGATPRTDGGRTQPTSSRDPDAQPRQPEAAQPADESGAAEKQRQQGGEQQPRGEQPAAEQSQQGAPQQPQPQPGGPSPAPSTTGDRTASDSQPPDAQREPESSTSPGAEQRPGQQQRGPTPSPDPSADRRGSRDPSASETAATEAAGPSAGSGEPTSPAERIRELQEQRDAAAERRAVSERLRERARRLVDGRTDERRAPTRGAEPMPTPGEPAATPDASAPRRSADSTGIGREAGAQDRIAPPADRPTRIEDFRLTGEDGAAEGRTIAEWLSEQPADLGNADGRSAAAPTDRVRQARDVAERAVDQAGVHSRYHRLIKRYFGRLNEAVDRARDAAPASAGPSPERPGGESAQ